MSSEEAEPLIGTDPADTIPVKVGGAVFTIGPMPAQVWERLQARALLSSQTARRKTMARLHAAGIDPEGPVNGAPPGIALTVLDMEAAQDPDHRAELMSVMLECARWSVRGHANFKRRDGSDFPFSTCEQQVESVTCLTVHPSTLNVYRVNARILEVLWLAIRRLNELGVAGKKD